MSIFEIVTECLTHLVSLVSGYRLGNGGELLMKLLGAVLGALICVAIVYLGYRPVKTNNKRLEKQE